MRAVGLVLAAGAGSRYGMPKAMARDADGESWCSRAVRAAVDGGCDDVVVVLGALAESAVHLVPSRAGIVLARDWSDGPGASLRAGLRAIGSSDADGALVTLVDLVDLRAESVARVLEGADRMSLRRAAYDGEPGHPVLVGRERWASFTGTRRPGDVLADLGATTIDCSDLGGGHDVDEQSA